MRRALVALCLALAACGGSGAEVPALSEGADEAARADVIFAYPEGPLVAQGALHVAEMGADRIWRADLAGAPLSPWPLPGCGPTALAPYGAGFVALCHLSGELAVLDLAGAELRRIGPEAGVAIRNPNDAASDLRGGVYFSDPGVFHRPRQPIGRLVWLDPQGRLHEVARSLNYPNGVYVVEDAGKRWLYASEHFSRRILRYPINDNGTLGPMSVWAAIPEQGPPARFSYDQAGPDGLERAADGTWYVAIYGEGRVLRLNEQGEVTGEVQTPFQYVTNLAIEPDGTLAIVGPSLHDRPPYTGAMQRSQPADFNRPRPQ